MRGLQALLLLKIGKEFVLLTIHLVKIAKVTWLHLFHELHKYMRCHTGIGWFKE